MLASDPLTIGQLAQRLGVNVSAIRFYESKGLVRPTRNDGGQRRFKRSDIRRLSFVLIAQQLGFTLEEICEKLAALPMERTPNKADWAEISSNFKDRLDEKIASMTRLRKNLDQCIGCGCLSLKACKIYNKDDRLSELGPGPKYILDPFEDLG